MNNDLWKKKFGNGFQVNFCNEQSDPTCAWNGFFFQRIDDLLIFSYSSNEDLDYCTGQNGAFSEDPVLGQCATWDEFLQKEVDALDRKMAEIMNGPDAPQWVIFATHQMSFTSTVGVA